MEIEEELKVPTRSKGSGDIQYIDSKATDDSLFAYRNAALSVSKL